MPCYGKICTHFTKHCGAIAATHRYIHPMHQFTARALETQRSRLLQRWEATLRTLPPSSGLAHPDSLMHLMPSTLEQVIAALARNPARRTVKPTPDCRCGMNPLSAYFVTGEVALIDILFTATPGWNVLSHAERERSLESLRAAVAEVAGAELEAFCSLCRRCPPPLESVKGKINSGSPGESVHGTPLGLRP